MLVIFFLLSSADFFQITFFEKFYTIRVFNDLDPDQDQYSVSPGLEFIKLEFILKLKIKPNDWLLADTCLQAANQCVLF